MESSWIALVEGAHDLTVAHNNQSFSSAAPDAFFALNIALTASGPPPFVLSRQNFTEHGA